MMNSAKKAVLLLMVLNAIFAAAALVSLALLRVQKPILDIGISAVNIDWLVVLLSIAGMFYSVINIFRISAACA